MQKKSQQESFHFVPALHGSAMHFSSLLQLRWGAIAGQILLIIIIALSQTTALPYPTVSAIILFETFSNLFFHRQQSKQQFLSAWFFAAVMFTDVMLLTALLYQTGGAMNPFTFLYLLHIVIGAILMPPMWSWSLAIFTILCYSSLLMPIFKMPIAENLTNSPQTICIDVQEAHLSEDAAMDHHLKGMLIAFAITSLFIVYFIGRIRQALSGHNEMIAQLEEQRLKNEKLASLATLAAGTAHEFSTPLSTIKVATGEMLYTLKTDQDYTELNDDLMLIRQQITKCEEIISQMSEDAGNQRCENFQPFTIGKLVTSAVSMLPDHSQSLIAKQLDNQQFKLNGPLRSLSRTLKEILKNSLDASKNSNITQIKLHTWQENGYFYFAITDSGPGIDQDTANRITEPFYTTKEPGKGMGLGLYLARSIAEQFDGRLDIKSEKGVGTTVTFILSEVSLRFDNKPGKDEVFS